eukprot:m.968574 g.968574  ORF g.968574 m.968574 type:complete len:137 (+) comp23917_c0_seq14:3917-4327(+)
MSVAVCKQRTNQCNRNHSVFVCPQCDGNKNATTLAHIVLSPRTGQERLHTIVVHHHRTPCSTTFAMCQSLLKYLHAASTLFPETWKLHNAMYKTPILSLIMWPQDALDSHILTTAHAGPLKAWAPKHAMTAVPFQC